MKFNNLFTISEFASIFNVSRKTLLYYANEKIFEPYFTSESNHYRYYSMDQLASFGQILALKEMEMSLDSIKNFNANKTVTIFHSLLQEQSNFVEKEIKKLNDIQEKIQLQLYDLELYFEHSSKNTPFIIQTPQDIGIYTSPYGTELNISKLVNIYKTTSNHKNSRQIGFGEVKSISKIGNEDYISDKIFVLDYDSATKNDVIKKGNYVHFYHAGSFKNAKKSFRKLHEYIRENHLNTHDEVYFYCIIGPHCSNHIEDYVLKIFVKLKDENEYPNKT